MQRWNRSGFLTTDQNGPDRTGRSTGGPTGLKFILEPLLSPDNDNWCRELERKTVFVLSGRYFWDPTEVLYIFTWKKQNFNVNTPVGLPVTSRSTGYRQTGRSEIQTGTGPAGNRYRFHLCVILSKSEYCLKKISQKPLKKLLYKINNFQRGHYFEFNPLLIPIFSLSTLKLSKKAGRTQEWPPI
jgi:hypothetical protein